MDHPSSTTSSKSLLFHPVFRAVGGLIIAAAVIAGLDRALYSAFFRIYDKPYRLSRVTEKADVLIVGASNILWGVDADLMSARLKEKVVILSIPGGDMEFRHHMLQNYLDKHPLAKPRLVILQTDRYFLNRGRYPAGAYKAIEGYYHKDILRDYISGKWEAERYGIFKRLFYTHSINSQFYLIASTYYERMHLPALSTALQAEPAKPAPAGNQPALSAKDAAKVEDWKKQYASVDDSVKIDPDYEMHFDQAVDALRALDVEAVFLETPIFNMFPDQTDDGYTEVRELLRRTSDQKMHYLKIKDPGLENDPSLFFDASHLNLSGRARYTERLITALVRRDFP